MSDIIHRASGGANVELCPTCRQPMPRDAKSSSARGARVKCAFCEKDAIVIIDRVAACFEHCSWPGKTRAERAR
jgi:hypothetical protein